MTTTTSRPKLRTATHSKDIDLSNAGWATLRATDLPKKSRPVGPAPIRVGVALYTGNEEQRRQQRRGALLQHGKARPLGVWTKSKSRVAFTSNKAACPQNRQAKRRLRLSQRRERMRQARANNKAGLFLELIHARQTRSKLLDSRMQKSIYRREQKQRNIEHGSAVARIPIHIKTPDNKCITLAIDPDYSVDQVKCEMQTRGGYCIDSQRLIFAGKQLEDSRLLSEYNIPAGSLLLLSLQLTGGAPFTTRDPTNRPFRVHRAHEVDGVRFEAGEVGYVRQWNKQMNKVQVFFPRRYEANRNRPQAEYSHIFVVDPSYVEVNFNATWGDSSINTNVVRGDKDIEIHDDNRDIAFAADEANLTKMAFQLLRHILRAQSQGHLPWLGHWFATKWENLEKLLAWCRDLSRAAQNAGCLRAFDHDRPWSFDNWFDSKNPYVQPIKSSTTGGRGVYLRGYAHHKTDSKMLPRTYVGQTQRTFGQRWKEHERATNNPGDEQYDSFHYREARQFKGRASCKLLEFNDKCPLLHEDRDYDVAETVMLCLFGAYRKDVLNYKPTATKSNVGQVVDDESQDSVEEQFTAMESASQLEQITVAVLRKRGWGSFTRTQCSGGMNRQTPIETSGKYSKLLWIHQDAGDRDTYSRTTSTVMRGGHKDVLARIGGWRNGKPSQWMFTHGAGIDGLKPKDKIQVTWEIMKHGRHPEAFGRLPDVMGWSNTDEVNKIAIRLNWHDNGQDKQIYLQGVQPKLTPTDGKVAGSTKAYSTCLSALMYLQGQDFGETLTWCEDWGLARIKTVAFDAWTQQFLLSTKVPGGKIDRPVIDHKTTQAKLNARGLTNYGGGSFFSRKCDTCYLMGKSFIDSRNDNPCQEKDKAIAQCKICFAFGRLCTFTDSTYLQAHSQQSCEALVMRAQNELTKSVQEVDAVKFVHAMFLD